MIKPDFYSKERYNTVRECLEAQFKKYDIIECRYRFLDFIEDGLCDDNDLFFYNENEYETVSTEEMIEIAEKRYDKYDEVFFTGIRQDEDDEWPSVVLKCIEESALLSNAFLRYKKRSYLASIETNFKNLPKFREYIKNIDFTDHIAMRRKFCQQPFRGCIVSENKKKVIKSLLGGFTGKFLSEHAFVGDETVNEYEHLLNTKYSGKRFVWCGQFCDKYNGKNFYQESSDYINSHKNNNIFVYKHFKYAINHDKKQYVIIEEENDNIDIIHPLPILCAHGNGYGLNDYKGKHMDLVGSWAFDHISVSNEKPDDTYELLDVHFLCPYWHSCVEDDDEE